MIVIEVRRYVAPGGSDAIGDWLASLADLKARARITARFDRLSLGNFGDCKALREGVCCVLLLCGGDKRRQSSEIRRAIEYLRDFKERTRSK